MVGTIYLDMPRIFDENLQPNAQHRPLLAFFFYLIGWVHLVPFNKHIFFFPVALQPNAGHGLLILEVSRSQTTTYHSQ